MSRNGLSRLAWFQRKRQQGATMIEVLITLLVLAIGLLGVAALQAFTLQSNQTAYYRSQATNLVYEVSDYARANRSRLIATGEMPDLAFWQARAAQLFPGGTLAVNVNAADNQIGLTIGWLDTRDVEDPEDGRAQFVITTRF